MEPTPAQREELALLARTFPYRVIFGALSPDGEWRAYAKHDRRTMRALARKGWQVWEVQR